MSDYLIYQEQTLTDLSTESITNAYAHGYLFGRKHKGYMYQTRSLRIDLSKFELTSENRRILRKHVDISMRIEPLPFADYSWEIHKLAKQFYTSKFGADVMSASKIKAMFTDPENENMTHAFVYSLLARNIGYCLSYQNPEIVHYCYPFYDLETDLSNLGLAMMTMAISNSQENGQKYVYLGSIADTKAKYKLQFKGLEWWDEQQWNTDVDELKTLVSD